MINRSCLDCNNTCDNMKYCEAYAFGADRGELPELITECERWEEYVPGW